MEINASKRGPRLHVKLSGELDHHSAEQTRNMLDTLLKDITVRDLTLDLSGVSFMDRSSACRASTPSWTECKEARMDNWMELTFPSLSVNEGFARAATAAFAALLNPTIDELSDLRTAVSEAVTNAIIHAYGNDRSAMITLRCETRGPKLRIVVKDTGCGIEDIELARRPFYTSKPELERSGMGFAVMEAFMDSVEIESAPGEGTAVTMEKEIGRARGD